MKLYSNLFSPNCRKVHAVAHVLGTELEVETVNIFKGEQRKPEYLRLNPNGKVPTLVDGETIIWESNAISCYLGGKDDTDLWPKSAARYDILRWMFWEANQFSKAISKVIGEVIFNRDNPNQQNIEKGIDNFRRYAAALNSALEDKPYLTGDNPTLADYTVGVWLGYEQVCGLPVNEFGHIREWSAKVIKSAGPEYLPPSP